MKVEIQDLSADEIRVMQERLNKVKRSIIIVACLGNLVFLGLHDFHDWTSIWNCIQLIAVASFIWFVLFQIAAMPLRNAISMKTKRVFETTVHVKKRFFYNCLISIEWPESNSGYRDLGIRTGRNQLFKYNIRDVKKGDRIRVEEDLDGRVIFNIEKM